MAGMIGGWGDWPHFSRMKTSSFDLRLFLDTQASTWDTSPSRMVSCGLVCSTLARAELLQRHFVYGRNNSRQFIRDGGGERLLSRAAAAGNLSALVCPPSSDSSCIFTTPHISTSNGL